MCGRIIAGVDQFLNGVFRLGRLVIVLALLGLGIGYAQWASGHPPVTGQFQSHR